MIIGFVKIENSAVNTHRDSYLLENLSVVSVRRPLAGAGLVGGIGAAAFGVSFSDLLYPGEILTVLAIVLICLLTGWFVAQLKLVSRETKGTELAGAVWGSVHDLQAARTTIVAALRALPKSGGVS